MNTSRATHGAASSMRPDYGEVAALANTTWLQTSRPRQGSGAPGSFGIRALAVDPHDPRRLLAGTAKRGIFTFTEP